MKPSPTKHGPLHRAEHCLCICPSCFMTWTHHRPDGTPVLVGICICRECECSQVKMAERIQSRLVRDRGA